MAMANMAAASATLLHMVQKRVDVNAVRAFSRRPFQFLMCGDPNLVSELRRLLLSGHEGDAIPLDAAACLETLSAEDFSPASHAEARAILFLGRRGDLAGVDFSSFKPFRLPVLAIVVDDTAQPSGPAAAPAPGAWAEYVVPQLTKEQLRGRAFTHLIDCAKGVEIAVGRRLPILREAVASKLTRDAANNALKVSLASAVVDHIPIAGIVLGAVASAGDMVAITGLQIMLMLHIEAAYGKDPDFARLWRLLPVIGGGLGWRSLARELVGFVPVAGIAIKGAVAYAGTIVVGEGVSFFLEHGHHMTRDQASEIYKRTKNDALRFARDIIGRFRRNE